MGGVVIDGHAQARKPDGGAFEGLYVVGTPVAGLEGGPRAGYVGGLSKAFILGLLAAEHIASVVDRRPDNQRVLPPMVVSGSFGSLRTACIISRQVSNSV